MRKKSLILLSALFIIFTAVYLIAQVDGEDELLPFDVQGLGATITSQWLTIVPTLDGMLSAGEWADAAAYDISNIAGAITPGTVTMYVKNDGIYLYIAVDDTNDIIFTPPGGGDFVGIYFDDVGGISPILYDNIWTNGTCGNPTGEGLIVCGNFFAGNTPVYEEWISGPSSCSLVRPAPGITQGISNTSGHVQYELVYDLTNSALNALPGDMFGFSIISYDSDGVPAQTTGRWPQGVTTNDPSTYGNLILAQPYYVTHTSDFNGDGFSDESVYRPSSGVWFVKGVGAYSIGGTTDIPVTGDYDGDGIADVATWDAGTWSFRYSSSTMRDTITYGIAGDIPVPGDYDGDGMTDIAVWRPSNGTWYIRGIRVRTYGVAGDLPVPGDYNGDGKTDLAIWRPSNSTWYVLGWGAITYGTQGDIPVPGDYNGLGQTDIAFWRPSSGIWFIRYSEMGNRMAMTYGISGDMPVPADYNGDGITDFACWRPTNGIWYLKGIGAVTYGIQGDYPTIR